MKAMTLLLLLAACADPGGGQCALQQVAELPVTLLGGVPVVAAEVNGRPATLVLDTGANATLLSRLAANRLGVPYNTRADVRLSGLAREVRASRGVIPVLQLGAAVVPNVQAVVSPGLQPPFDGLLGVNALIGFDLDLDVPRGTLALYRARRCAGALPPWAGTYTRLAVQQDGNGFLYAPVFLDGQPARALLDTGASRSTFGVPAAADTGVTMADLRRGPAGLTRSVDSAGTMVRPRQFRELRVGNDVLDNPVFNVVDLPLSAGDGIIGSDYLATRRVWIALAIGAVFTATADQPRPR